MKEQILGDVHHADVSGISNEKTNGREKAANKLYTSNTSLESHLDQQLQGLIQSPYFLLGLPYYHMDIHCALQKGCRLQTVQGA